MIRASIPEGQGGCWGRVKHMKGEEIVFENLIISLRNRGQSDSATVRAFDLHVAK